MLRLRSEVFPDIFEKRITYSDNLLFIGSCFAENMGQKVIDAKISAIQNPFGIMYNPESVKNCLEIVFQKKQFTENQLSLYNEKWISFAHHGMFSGVDKELVMRNIKQAIDEANIFLKKADFLFITFGTAWVYKLKKTNQIVANCHKLNASEFEHFILQTDEIVSSYKNLINQLCKFNPKIEIIFTVSPVRHWKDGAVNNQISKSTLIMAVHELIKENKKLHYFPSYEIMMDDLRDYRFYANDLFHPNETAVEYIWEKFSDTFLDKTAIETAKKVEQLRKNVEHKVFYPETLAYKKFITANLRLIDDLKTRYPNLNFTTEENYFINEGKKYFPNQF